MRLFVVMSTIAVAIGLVPAPAHAVLQEVQAQRARCDDYDLDSLASALGRLHGILSKPGARPIDFGGLRVPAATYAAKTILPLLEAAGSGDRARVCDAIGRMRWFRAGPLPANKLLFSAYYTPSVPGSLVKDARFRYPLYKRPPDAKRYDSAQILGGALDHRGLELVYLEDGYDALALQVEGSAEVKLPDGSVLALGTDGNNGRPYTNVSKLLIADGKMPKEATPSSKPGSPRVRAYFDAHPDELVRYWSRNPHYVFFKRVQMAGGGKLGALTNGRSIAVDPAVFPIGGVVLLRPLHAFPGGDGTPARVAIAMDTGAAIKGPGRIDVYFGDSSSTSAEQVARGSVSGEAYILLAR